MLDGKFFPHVFLLINFEGFLQTVQALRGELERVDELESVHSDGEILPHVLWNYPHLSNEFMTAGSFHSDFDILYARLHLLCAVPR